MKHWIQLFFLGLTLFFGAQAQAADELTFIYTDLYGSPVAAADEDGYILWKETYTPFGERMGGTGDEQNNLWYTGKRSAKNTPVINFGARHYNPDIGRFYAIDPVGVTPDNIHSFGRYTYGNNNPYAYIDPDGEWAWAVVFAAIDFAAAYKETGSVGAATKEAIKGAINPLGKLKRAAKAGKATKNAVQKVAKTDPKITTRPSSFRKKTIQDSWDKASPGKKPGAKACPTCGKDVHVAPGQGRRDWDVDHQPPWSKRDLSGMKTRKEVLDEYNKGTRLECPSCNRSRGAKDLVEELDDT